MENKNVEVPEGYKKTELGVIPEEWEIVQIDQFANINKESRDPTKNSEEFFYYIDIDAVENGTGLIKNPKKLSGKEAPSRARRVIHKDDVIMSTVRPYHKAFALVPQLYDNQICSTGFAVLSCGKNLDPKYFLQFLFSGKVIDQCTSMMAGGQYPALNTTQVSKIKITAPSLPEQQKIASILSKVDEQIEQTERIIEKTEILKKSLMQKLLTKGIGHTKFKKTELGEIPEEWEVGKLSNISQVAMGQSPAGDTYNTKREGKPLINGPSEFNQYYPTPVKWTSKPTKVCKVGDLLFCVRGNTLGRMNFADQEYCIGRGIAAIRGLKNTGDTNFIHLLLTKEGTELYRRANGEGSTFPNIKRDQLNEIKIAIPPLYEQQKIASILSKVDSQIQDNQNYLTKLQELKKGLMQDLLTGKVRVTT